MAWIQTNPESSLIILNELSSNLKAVLLPNSYYNETEVTTNDKIKFLEQLANANEDYKTIIKDVPESIQNILLPASVINGVEISSQDKIEFLSILTELSEDATATELYEKLEDAPNNIYEMIEPKVDMDEVVKIGIIILCIYLASALFNFGQGFIMANVSNKYAKRMRSDISSKINKLPLKYFDRHTIRRYIIKSN